MTSSVYVLPTDVRSGGNCYLLVWCEGVGVTMICCGYATAKNSRLSSLT